MSIIVTHISQHGIIHATDSNLTDKNWRHAGTGEKLFEIKKLGSALTLAGFRTIGGTRIDKWMEQFISKDTSRSLAEFVDNLRDTMNTTASNEEKKVGYFIHIAGYSYSGHIKHPEFYHITNYQIERTTGGYFISDLALRSSEDFWRNNKSTPLSILFAGGKGFIYCNGYPAGRQAYFTLLQFMANFRSLAWNHPDWEFRSPSNIDEEAAYLKNDMEHINLLFLYSNYPSPFIGGEIKIHTIPSP